ncbi:ATP-binding cassette domain-containing protein [Lactiplantibacillus pentosus]|nr:ATP-binding cassette domain-containing protein [Lactiplantibacillus pentosus]MBU7482525.1 ATP-binding cassette domain-containing protein [Lactiplantibacillus sp. 30.2.29]MBU7477210.1 ATP-binding cassette domain-containing protein [Lactiplantibacillus pentosus]MBU7485717.1 ATP-binding cassette domain-containing protein [Lactiplantibacillus pentosus]MBU7498641.1 ATP-binding cassette domain-containing protein [Lactiplantibacillus pentosus]
MMRVEHLSYQFDQRSAPFFDDLSFELKSPGVNFLIGQNGAGKTTLADILTGLRPATGALALPQRAIYLNQQLPLLSSIRVRDVAQLVLGIEDGRLQVTLADFKTIVDPATYEFLAPLWDQRYGQLSGGQRKLVQLLLFLQVDRELVVLDEPTAAVDRQNVQLLFQVMQAHPERTYLMITHDIRDMQAFDEYQVLWLDQRQVKTLSKAAFESAGGQEDFVSLFKEA